MNYNLLSPVTRIMPGSKQVYVYVPAIVTSNDSLRTGDMVKVLEVHKGDTPDQTTVKVMKKSNWLKHEDDCRRFDRDEEDPLCECEYDAEHMTYSMRSVIHYILLSDLRK